MNNNKKLYKNKEDVVIAGVCSGLAEYLNMEVSMVRILTVLIVLFTGIGVIPYILFAVLLPDKSEVVYDDGPVFEEKQAKKEDDLYEYNEEEYKS